MLKNTKLKNVSWLFTFMLLCAGITLIVTVTILQSKVDLIEKNWVEYQSDRSDKARLESALRACIGYGGMIHDFKNYILRHDHSLIDHVNSHIGAANGVIDQYAALHITEAEKIALDDIKQVINAYHTALTEAKKYIKAGISVKEIDTMVKVDDSPAFRGLTTLQQEVKRQSGNGKPLSSKGRTLADIRAAIGYGGLIHEFKNFVLRQDIQLIATIRAKIATAQHACSKYLDLKTSGAERMAIDDIRKTIFRYEESLNIAIREAETGSSAIKIDSLVRVNDSDALRGLAVLDRETAKHIGRLTDNVDESFSVVGHLVKTSTMIVAISVSFIIIFLVWLFHAQVVAPIQKLINVMGELTKENFDIHIPYGTQSNEIGRMASAVEVFKENSIARKEAETYLSIANDELNQKFLDIEKLREEAEVQAKTAMNLAKNLSAAREEAIEAVAISERQEHYVSSILKTVMDAVITIDRKGLIETFNAGAEAMFRYKSEEARGRNISILMPEPYKSEHDGYIQAFFAGKSTRIMGQPVEKEARRKDGTIFPVEITLNTLQIGNESKFTGVIRDITERKEAEKEIRRLALHDPLTSLANRNQFDSCLNNAIKLVNRSKHNVALVLLDLDKFKPVNDTFGHHIGDEVLKHVAQELKSCFREVDTVARLGGDEFAVIIGGINEPCEVTPPVERVVKRISRPVTIEGHTITIGASVGISFYPQDCTDREELFQHADIALYKSKRDGRNRYTFFRDM